MCELSQFNSIQFNSIQFYLNFSEKLHMVRIISVQLVSAPRFGNKSDDNSSVIAQKLVDFELLIANCKLQNIKWEWKLALVTLKC